MWNKFLDGLSTDGGNIFVLLFLIILIGVFVQLKFPNSTEQLYFAIGALIGILKGNLTHTVPTENKNPPTTLLNQ